ncbi:DUF4259 domain-containing protein [Paenibacillus vandeheii]
MGAWGTGIFENDDVLDWKLDLFDTDDMELIEETIEEVLEEEYIETDLASNALGAVEILAALQGSPGKEILNKQSDTEDLYDWINTHKGKGKELISKAKRAVVINIKTVGEINANKMKMDNIYNLIRFEETKQLVVYAGSVSIKNPT